MAMILITGGSGYIGSAIVLQFILAGHTIIIIDKKLPPLAMQNLSAHFFQADFADTATLHTIFTDWHVDAVIHCAASIEVGLSVKDPAEFYMNNVSKTVVLLDTMRTYGVMNIIFSSSCAVFGIPTTHYLEETHTKLPISPYGRTKLMVEMILQDYVTAYDMTAVSLRYFNAAGAWLEYGLGERHEPETHLIPCMIKAMLQRTSFTLFGANHQTPDGTCIRDYLHIRDLAQAHLLAYEYTRTHKMGFADFNLGTGTGTSINQMITALEKISGKKMSITELAARTGDPAYLVAQATKAEKLLGWKPLHSSVDYILTTALAFYSVSSQDIKKSEDVTPRLSL